MVTKIFLFPNFWYKGNEEVCMKEFKCWRSCKQRLAQPNSSGTESLRQSESYHIPATSQSLPLYRCTIICLGLLSSDYKCQVLLLLYWLPNKTSTQSVLLFYSLLKEKWWIHAFCQGHWCKVNASRLRI